MSEYDTNTISLYDINSLVNEISNNGFNFKVKKLLLKSEKLKDRGILANEILFKTLLDNILTNANKYAFSKQESGNEVIVELTEVDDILSMEIKIPKSLNKDTRSHKNNLKTHGSIDFIHGSRSFLNKSIYNHQPKVADMILFPNYLMHTAYPFQSGEERRSFSFNAEIDQKIANVFKHE